MAASLSSKRKHSAVEDRNLCKAAKRGHSDTVKVLIDAGADVEAKTNHDDITPLHESASGGHSDTVKVLIDARADVDAKTNHDDTPLHESASGGHSDTVKVLIDAGADVDAQNGLNDTPLHESASRGHSDTVKVLRDAGTDVNAKNSYRDTPLHESASRGNSDTVKVLIAAGADADAVKNGLNTPLHDSAWGGHSDTVKVLIDAGADVHAKNSYHGTPLHKSASKGHSDTVKVLIAAGADVHAKDENNDTPLHESAGSGHSDTVNVLMDAGADLNNKNKMGLAPIHLAVQGGHSETVNVLSKHFTLEDDSDAMSILHLLMLEASTDIMQIVYCNSPICNARGKYNRTILNIAAHLGCSEHIKCLLSCSGIDVTLRDDFGNNLLHCAIEVGNLDTIKTLINAGCDIKQFDDTGKSVLHLAAIYGQSDLIKYFIDEYGLDPYQIDNEKRNCVHYAVIYRREDTVALLLTKHNDSGKSYNTNDYKDKKPIDYLHSSEKDSLISKHLLEMSENIPIIDLCDRNTALSDSEYCPNTINAPYLSTLSQQPYIGSVTTIKGLNNEAFVKNVKMRVEQVIREVIPEVTSVEANIDPLLVEVIGVGSSFEGTKHGMPDEFDFLVTLGHWVDLPKHEGYGMAEKAFYVMQKNIIGSFGMCVWSRLMAYWSECKSKDKLIHSDSDRSFCMPLPPQRHPDRKTCSTWIWLYSDEMFNDLPVSIDLVPALDMIYYNIKDTRSTWMMSKHKMCYIVPKIPHMTSKLTEKFEPKYLTKLGRVSYPTLEVEHIQALDDRVKNVFITAKCVRKIEVCGFKIRNGNGDVKSVSELVTSYRLKSVFLHLVELFLKSDMSLGKMVLMVYEELQKCLERGHLPMFFNPGINVLAGSKLSTEESLKVTRMMTRFVRSLYERDFTPEQQAKDAGEEARALERQRAAHDERQREYEREHDAWIASGSQRWVEIEVPKPPFLPLYLHK